MIPAFNGANHFFFACSSTGGRSSATSGPRPDGNGRGQGWTPSQSPALRTGSRNNPVIMNVNKSTLECTDPWLQFFRLLAPRQEPLFRIFAVCLSIQPDDPPAWRGLLMQTTRAAVLRENRGHCMNCNEDSHSLKQCRHPLFICELSLIHI